MALKERKPYNHLPVITSCGGPLGILPRLLHIFQNCSTLQHFVTHCNTLHCRALQLILNIIESCSKLPHPATRCNTLQCPALQRTAPRCTTLHHTTPHCTALQNTATNFCEWCWVCGLVCSIVLRIATHCNTLLHTSSSH